MTLERTQRRWPTAYDGGSAGYRGSPLDRLRRSPIRHGMLGMAVVGAAVPLGVSRYQDARTDPSHERSTESTAASRATTDQAVAAAWRALKNPTPDVGTVVGNAATRVAAAAGATTTAGGDRESVIATNVQRFSEFGVSRRLAEIIYDAATAEGIDPEIAFGLVRTESSFKNSATSHVGAVGLTQLMPRTAQWLKPGTTMRDLRDPTVNARIGFSYMKDLIEKYDGNTRLALLAYNRGPGTVDRVLKRGGDPDNGYADAVLNGCGRH